MSLNGARAEANNSTTTTGLYKWSGNRHVARHEAMRSTLRLAVAFSSVSISPLKASHSLCSHNHVGSCLAANKLSESAMEKKHSQGRSNFRFSAD